MFNHWMGAAACALALAVTALGCGSSSTSTTQASADKAALAAWRANAQRVCREGQAALARLGYVHITYAGIAREGLPAVKRKVDRYFARVQAILLAGRRGQQRLAPPAELRSAAAEGMRIDRAELAATKQLRAAVARARTTAQFTAAFKAWVQRNAGLVTEGNAVARRLGLPACTTATR